MVLGFLRRLFHFDKPKPKLKPTKPLPPYPSSSDDWELVRTYSKSITPANPQTPTEAHDTHPPEAERQPQPRWPTVPRSQRLPTRRPRVTLPSVPLPITPALALSATTTGSESPSSPAGERTWEHFDGEDCEWQDFYIDLKGNRHDQYVPLSSDLIFAFGIATVLAPLLGAVLY